MKSSVERLSQRLLFALGYVKVSDSAVSALNPNDVAEALFKHSTGDWGEVSEQQAKKNAQAVLKKTDVISIHTDRYGHKFQIRTEISDCTTTITLFDQKKGRTKK